MLNTDELTIQHQERLLNSLAKKVSLTNLPQPKLEIVPKIKNIYRSGHGGFDDHRLLMKHYICHCGYKFSVANHSTTTQTNGTALDTYAVSCNSCGEKEEVSFMSMRNVLLELGKSTTINTLDKSKFPYI